MKFEWDFNKSRENKKKHGIDFEMALSLRQDVGRIEIHAPHPVENRHILVGKLKKKLWVAIYTFRGDATRIISVRRAREKEEKIYGKEKRGKER